MYSIVPSRAGLVVLIFALIISFVSAAPIPISASQSGFSPSSSHSNRNGQDIIHRDTPRIAQIQLNGPTSTISVTTRALIDNTLVGADSQIVRRSVGSKIRAAFSRLWHGIKHVAQKIGSGIKRVAQKIGSGIKRVAQKIGSGIKRVAQKIGSGIKRVAQKIGSGIKTAAKRVGTFIKNTGAKIAKFGLKVISAVTEVAAKVVGFIPGIGKPIGKAMEGVSEVENFVSDKIHANLGSKLEKGMNVIDKAKKIMGYIPRRRDLSAEEGFWQRDISDAY